MKLPDKVSLTVAPHGAAMPANSIGALLVNAGKLTPAQVEQVLSSQRDSGLLFGDEAIRLGFVRPRDVEQALARQFEYPYLVPGQSKVRRDIVAAYNPFSAEVEVFRAIRGQLLQRWFGTQPDRRALAITSPARGDGRSYVAANLAVVFSQLGERTLLIDADLRNPRQHVLFGVNNAAGLSSVLSGRAGVEAIVKLQDLVDLSLLPAGPTSPNPGDLVARVPFSNQIEHAIRTYDVVIVDTPAANLGNDAQSIAHRARGTLLVARKDRTRLEVVEKMTEDFRSAGIEVLGALLNEV
jgi:protein-tyrosine kinase